MAQHTTKTKLRIVKEALKTGKIKATAANYDIAERTLRYWIAKVKAYGKICLEALENKSRKPSNSPNKITDIKIINKIIELLKKHKCGLDSLILWLKKEKIEISKSAVRRICKEYGLYKEKKNKRTVKHTGKHCAGQAFL